MRNSKDRWSFYSIPNKPALTAEETKYWRNILSKILKVGLEFEFNLPNEKTGTCKGDSNTCPCSNLTPANECWQQCINVNGCTNTSKVMATCANVTGTCETEACGTCEHYQMKCVGITCPNFISACFTCKDYGNNCADCKYKYDPNKNPDAIRQHLTDQLKPNNSYGVVAPTGVHSIVPDGSLLGKKGAEVITVGRRVDYWEFYKMAKRIIDLALKKGAYINERCSIHMHVLASYHGKTVPGPGGMSSGGVPDRVSEMERDMPEVIMANFHQLVRRYQNAMTWMTMGLDDPEHLTRWEKFRVSVLPYSAVTNSMKEVRSAVSHGAGGNKYGWVNYNQCEFTKTGDIRRFHVEMRAADGIISPSAVAAIACMYYALAIKAAAISRYGVAECGDEGWMGRAEEIKKAMLNGTGDYKGSRFGNTKHLHKYYDILVGESLDLVRQLKPILIKIGPAYEVLERLAERPVALRRVEGHSWDRIEDDLKIIMSDEGKFEVAISEVIQLNQVTECRDLAEWVESVGNVLRDDPDIEATDTLEDDIARYVDIKQNDGELLWSTKIGAPITV